MDKTNQKIDKVRVSRAGHTFHERWAARRALQLVFPKDNLFAIVVEGLSPNETLKLGKKAEDIADLILFYGNGDTFDTCSAQQIQQFKYKEAAEPVTSSYLKKTVQKFAATLRKFKDNVSDADISEKLSFGFVTNAKFSDDLWQAIRCLKSDIAPETRSGQSQLEYLQKWCEEENVKAKELFAIIEFRAATDDLPAQTRALRRTISDWSANSTGQSAKRLYAMVELVREKAQIEGQDNNSIRREDVLDALECDEDQLFPADTQFVDVGDIVERVALQDIHNEIEASNLPVFLYADGGVGKTVFIQSLAAHLADSFEVVVFDCFGGGAYRSEARARHLPKVGLLQIINELATRGLCDPLLPTDGDQQRLIYVARKRLEQACETVKNQSAMDGVLIVLDAADNAQLEANARNEASFPRLLLASLSEEPIDGVKLLLTARPHRMDSVTGKSQVMRLKLEPFNEIEIRCFLESRRNNITDVEFSTVLARSRGNARVLEYLIESWDENVSGSVPQTEITVEVLIAEKCRKIFKELHTLGWTEHEVCEFFAALSLLPPPIPLDELAKALGWSDSQVNSAASDLAPMLELVKHGAIFRDEPTETYIRDQYANEASAQQSIAQRLQTQQTESIYAAEALPHFLVVIGDSKRAYELAESDEFPVVIESEYGRRSLKLSRLNAAFSLATKEKDLDKALSLSMRLAQAASANARGDQFIRQSPSLATILGDSDSSRRLFNDRSGWRGARDARLVVAYCFSDELVEAYIHQNRCIGWVNWYLHNDDDETNHFNRPSPEASDIAAIMFLNVLKRNFSSFNQHIKLWRPKFALSIVYELITLCTQHEESNISEVLQDLAKFAASKSCLSLILQIGFLSTDSNLARNHLKAISRAASSLSQKQKKKLPDDSYDHKMKLQGTIASAAMGSIIVNSRQSAKRLLQLCRHRRPSGYDYCERHGTSNIWTAVHASCVAAWSSGEVLSYHNLIPEEVKTGKSTTSISSKSEFDTFLDSRFVTDRSHMRQKSKKPEKRKQFSQTDRGDIVKGVENILKLVKPIETALLSRRALSNEVLAEFLAIWKDELRPNIHWRSETGKDSVTRLVGMGLVRILLQHCETVEEKEAKALIELISENRFSLGQEMAVFELIARHPNLADVTGTYASSISSDILKDDYIEQRGESYRDLAGSLIPMSINEAQAYYTQGLAQLDQMGSDDFDMIHSALHYAADQPGGFVKPELSHRLMNLCHTIFQHEPSKFGWTLFSRAASSSIGYPAMYKLIRWHNQDIVDYSYGLPQLACFLAKAGHLDPRRAAILLTICEDHGWHEWQVGKGLSDLLSVANPDDRNEILSLVIEKLDIEHSFGGWEGLWGSLIDCIGEYEEVNKREILDRLVGLRDTARHRRDTENARNNYNRANKNSSFQIENNEQNRDKLITTILTEYDYASVICLDEALQEIQKTNGLPFDTRDILFNKLMDTCPYGKRVEFLEALCESAELGFGQTLELMIKGVELWCDNSEHVKKSVSNLINRLFSFKGSELFDIRYSGISRQIHLLSSLSQEPKFVLQTVLETIVKEKLELSGDEWLQIATSLSSHTNPSSALDAFEYLLSSSAAKVGDDIGEGEYLPDYAGKGNQEDVMADVTWHLLGDSDAFIRWKAAKSVEGMVRLGLIEDIICLLDRFDVDENLSLASEEHDFSFMNAQQWFLMGLARAALRHGEFLKPLKARLILLAKRTDIHVLNKLHIVRCLSNIEGDTSISSELESLWNEVHAPTHGIIESEGWPDDTGHRIDFDFDHDFMEYKISNLARLFGISSNEANNYVANEVTKLFPKSKNMSDFPGRMRYRGDERYETYREHVQRHAWLHAASTLVKSKPVRRASYYWREWNPWQDFLSDSDVSFKDGSWLSDHKDILPEQARERFVIKCKKNEDRLTDKKELIRKAGFSTDEKHKFLPIYGHWTSPDGVYVNVNSALIHERGAVNLCKQFAQSPNHDLWLPTFNSSGRIDRHVKSVPYNPLICVPEGNTGIDEREEWASQYAARRPKLGLALNKVLELSPDKNEKYWYDNTGKVVLKSEVWGEWKPEPNSHGRRCQDEGVILWADRDWLDSVLNSCKRSLIFNIDFSRYKSSNHFEDSIGLRSVHVGLKKSGELPRFWFAKNASETVY